MLRLMMTTNHFLNGQSASNDFRYLSRPCSTCRSVWVLQPFAYLSNLIGRPLASNHRAVIEVHSRSLFYFSVSIIQLVLVLTCTVS